MAQAPRPAPRRSAPKGTSRRSAPRPSGGSSRGEGEERPPRGEYVPGPKRGAPVAVTVGVIALVVSSGLVFLVSVIKRGNEPTAPVEVVETDNRNEWSEIVDKMATAKRMARETLAIRTDEDQADLFVSKLREALKYTTEVLTEFDNMIEPIRDPVTEDVPPEYLGYLAESKPLIQLQDDLLKSMPFDMDFDDPTDE